MHMQLKQNHSITVSKWFKHGDHPIVGKLGTIPEFKCEKCGKTKDEHGWCMTVFGSIICPGNWLVVTDCQGRKLAKGYSDREFAEEFEPAQSNSAKTI